MIYNKRYTTLQIYYRMQFRLWLIYTPNDHCAHCSSSSCCSSKLCCHFIGSINLLKCSGSKLENKTQQLTVFFYIGNICSAKKVIICRTLSSIFFVKFNIWLFIPPMITVHTVPALLAALPSYAATLLAASICWSAVEVNWKKAHSN